MITWQDLQEEVNAATAEHGDRGLDVVRRQAYADFVTITKRPLLVYATAFQNPLKAGMAAQLMSIDLSDKDGFREILNNLSAKKADVIIHSPGGSAEATESIVEMLRAQFTDVRFIITGTAKSAATMLVMSGNSVLMDVAGELGPIDPQIALGNMFVPAGSLKEEFDKAAEEISENPERLPVWLPILEKYTPALLTQCDNFTQLARDLVSDWLKRYMLKGDTDKDKKAEKIARFLADEKNTLSHARRVNADRLAKLGVVIEKVEDQPNGLQTALRKVHLSISMTLDSTMAIKIFESSEDRALIRQFNVQPMLPFQNPPGVVPPGQQQVFLR